MAEPAKPKLVGATAIKPKERHGWEKISYLLYNKDTGEILTRTPKSWLLITIFYIIYYTLLASFWYAMLRLFFLTVPDDHPKYQQAASIIGNNPGVGMKPMQADIKLDSSMIYLKKDDSKDDPSDDGETLSNADWAKRYDNYLDRYQNTSGTTEDCSNLDTAKEACRFDTAQLGACAQHPFGYLVESGKEVVEPCVMLKINRIFGWTPQKYSEEDLEEAQTLDEYYPEDQMPSEVAEKIKADGDKIYLDCSGENPFDKETLVGKMKYFPQDAGIPFHYFPYEHAHRNYHNPMVAVKFSGLNPGVLYHIQCKLWAKGVTHLKKERAGLVHFEIFLDAEVREEK